ncbi:MAG: 16S rRNA (adenine(1518)-N(6)/adenine(1519)-N(6))-dimethyltransferase RsmA [Gammaproteobacteria bacterium]|nr:16S rRNA (adenine(1518)-N(6)/adenine(1519)-N(6))-dimethyltransferase RsmA [Gammaproteobacteria bacterium]
MLQNRARKRFGQNFLCDSMVVEKIIAAIAPKKTDRVVEIGPGLGALTTRMLPIVGKMMAIEIDRDLIPKLRRQCQHLGELTIYQTDVLKFDFSSLDNNDHHKLRIIGNLPYNISTPLIFHLLNYANLIKDMHLMFQKEVGERLGAKVGSKKYGRLTVMAQYFCKIELLFIAPPEAFKPKPKIQSAFVRLIPYKVPPYQSRNFDLFQKIVKTAFIKRRKTLKNALKNFPELPENWPEKTGIDPHLRPEQISIEQYVILSNLS